MGNDKKITINEDPWIPRKGNPKPLSIGNQLKGFRVNLLLDEGNKWKEDFINQSFLSLDAEDILSIPTRNKDRNDEIFWGLDKKKGVFTIKGAYHLEVESMEILEPSLSDKSKSDNIWKSIWNSRVVPKMKTCSLKIVNDIIPSKANILKKGVDLNPICFLCGKKIESTAHLIWGCKSIDWIWRIHIPKTADLFS